MILFPKAQITISHLLYALLTAAQTPFLLSFNSFINLTQRSATYLIPNELFVLRRIKLVAISGLMLQIRMRIECKFALHPNAVTYNISIYLQIIFGSKWTGFNATHQIGVFGSGERVQLYVQVNNAGGKFDVDAAEEKITTNEIWLSNGDQWRVSISLWWSELGSVDIEFFSNRGESLWR